MKHPSYGIAIVLSILTAATILPAIAGRAQEPLTTTAAADNTRFSMAKFKGPGAGDIQAVEVTVTVEASGIWQISGGPGVMSSWCVVTFEDGMVIQTPFQSTPGDGAGGSATIEWAHVGTVTFTDTADRWRGGGGPVRATARFLASVNPGPGVLGWSINASGGGGPVVTITRNPQ